MKFSINFTNQLKYYRLKKDNTWQLIDDFRKISDNDRLFDSPERAKESLNEFGRIEIEGKVVYPIIGAQKPGGLKKMVLTHRDEMPSYILTREDLLKVVRNGDDRFDNILVLDFQGKPHLIRITDDYKHTEAASYPIRHERFPKNSRHVGGSISISNNEAIYLTFLKKWCAHLKTGKMLSVDHYTNSTEDEILNELKEILQ